MSILSKYLTYSDDRETKLQERFLKYETELSAANRKIADRIFLALCSDCVVTMIASQSEKSATSSELQVRIDQLIQQLATNEEDKRKLTQEKDELQQQLSRQKDRTLEVERDAGYDILCLSLIAVG